MADSPANHVTFDADGNPVDASKKPSMEGAEPELFRGEAHFMTPEPTPAPAKAAKKSEEV